MPLADIRFPLAIRVIKYSLDSSFEMNLSMSYATGTCTCREIIDALVLQMKPRESLFC